MPAPLSTATIAELPHGSTLENVRVGFYLTASGGSDIQVAIVAPDDREVVLWWREQTFSVDPVTAIGADSTDDGLSIYDHDAADGIWTAPAPYTGFWREDYGDWSLADLLGEPATGTWKFKVYNWSDTVTCEAVRASMYLTVSGVEYRYDFPVPLEVPVDADPTAPTGSYVSLDVVEGVTDVGLPGLLPAYAQPGFFRIKLTSLHYPAVTREGFTPRDAVRAQTLALLEDYSNAEVVIPINDARTASVTISMDDPAAAHVRPYSTLLHITYVSPRHAHLVFWGILTQPEWNSASETVKLNAVDMSLRLQHHYVRWGDQILNGSDATGTVEEFGYTVDNLPNPHNTPGWKRSSGRIPLDHVGLRWLRDAADNEAYQDARGVPPLGIMDGFNDVVALPDDTPHIMEIGRGDNVWEQMQALNTHGAHGDFVGAPDFELEPHDDGVDFFYARLNTYIRQGNSDPSRLIFHDGFGKDNATITYTPGGKIINLAHVLSTGDQERVTVIDFDSSGAYGIYNSWDTTGLPAGATDALYEYGQQLVDAYGDPPDYFTTTPNLDMGLHYHDHFLVGDAMTAVIRRGALVRSMTADIVSVTLKQADQAGNVATELDSRVIVGSTTDDVPPRPNA
jgi:hypothetical protein